jgi:hypothetical protein
VNHRLVGDEGADRRLLIAGRVWACASVLAAKLPRGDATGSSACGRGEEGWHGPGARESAAGGDVLAAVAETVLGSGGACAEDDWGCAVCGAGRGS